MNDIFPINPILMVDDDEVWLKSMSLFLKRKSKINNIIACSNPKKVVSIMANRAISVVLLDYTMPQILGDRVLSNIKGNCPDVPVVLLTGNCQVDTAVKCMQYGAFDYFVKTGESKRILSGILRAIKFHETLLENRLFSSGFLNNAPLQPRGVFAGLWTRSFRMLRIYQYLESIAKSSVPVLITGEPGTGKTTIAQAIHSISDKSGEFVYCNIFKEGSSFLSRFGNFLSKAEGGTLYFDGIEHLDNYGEELLLRLISSIRLPSEAENRAQTFTGRIIISTNIALDSNLRKKELLLEFSSCFVQLPPLRERREDIPVLVDCFLDDAANFLRKVRPTLPSELFTILGAYHFPNNITELRDMVFEAMSLHSGSVLSLDLFKRRIVPVNGVSNLPTETPLVKFIGKRLPTLDEVESILITEAHQRSSGNQGVMANILGISRTAVNKRLKTYQERTPR